MLRDFLDRSCEIVIQECKGAVEIVVGLDLVGLLLNHLIETITLVMAHADERSGDGLWALKHCDLKIF